MKISITPDQQEQILGITTEYPYTCHYHWDLSKLQIPWHWHEEVEFGYVARGAMKVTTLGKTRYFREGEGFFMNSNVLATMEKDGDTCLSDSFIFHPIFLSGHFRSIFETKYMAPILQNRKIEVIELRGENPTQKKILKSLCKLGSFYGKTDMEFQTRNVLGEIWLALLDEIRTKEFDNRKVSPASQERIQNMMAFIHENYARKLTLDDIAQAGLVGKRECIRCFGECIKKTPFEYLQDYRIHMAARFLKETDLSVTEIAFAAGFSNCAYFGKVFKEQTGKTPGQYRKN